MKVYNEAHLNILTTTKDVYINQINNYLQQFICEGFISIYQDSLKENKINVNQLFKKYISEIPKWDNNIIDKEYLRFFSY